ncbi:RNA polymerase sigma factor [Marinobacter confluentis]|uniref:RNA polymerase sigma factor n=1 Tax=Marinobacter confluentis TaxID=1697557 RepID=UPI0021E6970C|nr:RNA polymerase sigma factor [Marinobacter confluentis]
MQPHLEPMYRFAFRLAGQQQDAEDLVQDVVVKLYTRLDELEAVEQLRPWLNRVLYRQFIDSVRRKGRRADVAITEFEPSGDTKLLDDQPAELPDIAEQLDLAKLGPALDRVMRTLTPDQRTLILLYDVDGWSQEDVAIVLDIPLGTVKSRIHRCRARLRKKLQESPELFPDSRRVGVKD